MTYNVSSGTLNAAILILSIRYVSVLSVYCVVLVVSVGRDSIESHL